MVEFQLFRGMPEKRRPDTWDFIFIVLGRLCDALKREDTVREVANYDISVVSE